MKRAIFIDKDGTLIRDIPYNIKPDLLQFTKGAVEALKHFRAMGFLLIIISNQSGVARGYFSETDLENLKGKVNEMLKAQDVELDAFFCCPHHPEGTVPPFDIECECRKPKPGLILQAAADFNIDLSGSWMIGDILNDVEAGNRAGCRTILFNNGNETEWEFSTNRIPTAVVASFQEAVNVIIHQNELV